MSILLLLADSNYENFQIGFGTQYGAMQKLEY